MNTTKCLFHADFLTAIFHISVARKITTIYTKIEAQHSEPGSDLKNTDNRGLESNLAITHHGQSGAIRSPVSDPAPSRRAPNIGQALNVATYNVRTLADTTRETERGPANFSKLLLAARNTKSTSSPFKNINSPQPIPSNIND